MANKRLRIGDYEAWVVVENEEIEHYGIEVNEETKTATCWIASTAGKHFGIWVARHHDIFDCLAEINLDGSLLANTSLTKAKPGPKRVDRAWSGSHSTQSFLFGKLNLTDDEAFLNTQSYEELGNIRVTIHRITDTKLVSWTPSIAKSLRTPENQIIHEHAKKTVTHQVCFGQTKKCRKAIAKTSTLQERVSTFVFRYRSLDILRANGIAPHNPSSQDVETVATAVDPYTRSVPTNSVSRKRKARVKEEDDTDVEIDPEDEEDKRKEAQLAGELERVRKALLDRKQSKQEQKKVKRETKPVFLPGEVIDLTI